MTADLVALRRLADELSVGSSEEQERVSFVRALTAACECADDYARVIRLVQDLQADIRNKHLTPPAPTAVAAEVEFVEELLSPAVAASSTLRRKRARDVVEDKEDSEMVPSKRIRFGKGPERHMQPPPDLPVVPHRRRRIVPDVDRDVEKDVERDAEGIIVNFRESTVMQALRLVKQRPQKAKKIAAEPHMDSVSTVGTSSRPAWTEEERKGWAGALENAKEKGKGKGKGKGKKATSDSEEVVKGFALVNGFNLEHEEDYEPDTFDSQSMCSVAGSVDEDRADGRKAIGN